MHIHKSAKQFNVYTKYLIYNNNKLTKQVATKRTNHTSLLVSYVAPHSSVSSKTIARWMTETLGAGGVDTSVFSQHATRAATSAHLRQERQLSAKQICTLANWSSISNTYEKFYNRYIR